MKTPGGYVLMTKFLRMYIGTSMVWKVLIGALNTSCLSKASRTATHQSSLSHQDGFHPPTVSYLFRILGAKERVSLAKIAAHLREGIYLHENAAEACRWARRAMRKKL